MVRTLTSTVTAHATASTLHPILMAQFKFVAGDLNLWTGYDDITVESEVFTGAGDLGALSPINETQDLRATGVDFSLSGIPASMLSLALAQNYQDRECSLWLGFMSSAGVYQDRVLLFRGRMDVLTIEEAGDTSAVSVSAESVLVTLERANIRRYTPEDQRISYPSDLGFNQVPALQLKEIIWGGSAEQ